MVEGKLRELERDPANVQLVIKEISGGLQRLELHDEGGAFLEVSVPGECPTLAPVSSCPSLASSRESVLDEPTDTGLHETLENANAEICSLGQLSEKQRLAILECKCLLSDTEEKATELALKNQQLTKLLAETEEKATELALKSQQLTKLLAETEARETELALENQQLTQSLAGTEEKMTKLVLECEELRKHCSGSEVECRKCELLQAKVRVKELWKDICDQIREFDYALWERDKELEYLRKQTGMKSAVTMSLATEQIVLSGHSSGATNVSRLLPSSTVDLHRDILLPNQTVPVLPKHVTTAVDKPASNGVTTSSKLLEQSHMPPTMESGQPVQVPSSFVLPSVSFHTGLPSMVSGNPARTVSTMMPHVWNVPCAGLHMSTAVSSSPSVTQAGLPVSLSDTSVQHRGKAPPIDTSTGEDAETCFDDWLPTLERAAAWNNWTDSETLMQLAGYLRGRALLEWNFMS
ncbi:coiled-coil domain-containing protein 158-like isoform X2 [Dysidea avara]